MQDFKAAFSTNGSMLSALFGKSKFIVKIIALSRFCPSYCELNRLQKTFSSEDSAVIKVLTFLGQILHLFFGLYLG